MQPNQQKTDSFILSSDDCELLLVFESCSSLQQLAEKIRRDHSVVSRQLKKIYEKMPVVEKKLGKWTLTNIGKELNQVTRSTIAAQSSLSKAQQIIRIGTNREFASRIVAPDFQKILKLFPNSQLTIQTFENGTESALLNGQIDMALDCDRPADPDISYKLVVEEPIVAVGSKSFAQGYKKIISEGNYQDLPHLLCARLHPDKILLKSENQLEILARFNDIAVTRSVCMLGQGWALLPRYAVKEELNAKSLMQIDDRNYGNSKYGVWWLRSRSYLKEPASMLIDWLSRKEL